MPAPTRCLSRRYSVQVMNCGAIWISSSRRLRLLSELRLCRNDVAGISSGILYLDDENSSESARNAGHARLKSSAKRTGGAIQHGAAIERNNRVGLNVVSEIHDHAGRN